jgi:hypothetical protein
VAATAAFAVAQYEWPGYRTRLAGGWLGVLGALSLVALASRLRTEYPPSPAPPRRPPRWLQRWALAVARIRDRLPRSTSRRSVTSELARIEGAVVESLGSANGVHRRLRPLVRDIVEDQLAVTYGLNLGRDAIRVRQLVGEDVWELIRPERPFPEDGFAPGLRLQELVALVDSLESLGAAG